MKCPNCGAENPETAWFCHICNRDLGPTYVEETDQAPVRVPLRRKNPIIILFVTVILIVSIVAATLAYYYQPVRGAGWSSLTTVCVGNPVEFHFSPHQGIAPYTYSWSFGDGGTSTGKDTFHTFHTVGTYTVTVVVTDQPGKKCTWSTTIAVRLPLVFIDQMYYPSVYKNPLGDTRMELYVDGAQVAQGVGLAAGETFDVEAKIIWVIDFGLGNQYIRYDTMGDKTGTITTPTTQTDLHYKFVWSQDAYGRTSFTLAPL